MVLTRCGFVYTAHQANRAVKTNPKLSSNVVTATELITGGLETVSQWPPDAFLFKKIPIVYGTIAASSHETRGCAAQQKGHLGYCLALLTKQLLPRWYPL